MTIDLHQVLRDFLPVLIPVSAILVGGLFMALTYVTKRVVLRSSPKHDARRDTVSLFKPWSPKPRSFGKQAVGIPASAELDPSMSLVAGMWTMVIVGLFVVGAWGASKQLPIDSWWFRVLHKNWIWTFILLFPFVLGCNCMFLIRWHIFDQIDPADKSKVNSDVAEQVRHCNNIAQLNKILDQDPFKTRGGYLIERVRSVLDLALTDPGVEAGNAWVQRIMDADEAACVRGFTLVRWCETALPLLGFLGTVWGFSLALPELAKMFSHPVATAATGNASVADKALTEALNNMAVAFDTTLIGLALLMVLGLPHVYFRKRMVLALNRTSELLLKIAGWYGSSSNASIIPIMPRSTSFFERVFETMVQEGKDPFWVDARRVLSRHITESSEEDAFTIKKRNELIEKVVGPSATLIGLGMSVRRQAGPVGVAMIRDNGTRKFLMRFQTGNGKQTLEDVIHPIEPEGIPTPDDAASSMIFYDSISRTALFRDHGPAFIRLEFPADSKQATDHVAEPLTWSRDPDWPHPDAKVKAMCGAEVGDRTYLVALIENKTDKVCELVWKGFAKDSPAGTLARLDTGFTWEAPVIDAAGTSLVLLGRRESDKMWRILHYGLQPDTTQGLSTSAAAKPIRFDLPLTSQWLKLAVVSATRSILCAEDGQLWDVSLDFNTAIPVLLESQQPLRLSRVFISDGRWLVGITSDDNQLRIWDARVLGKFRLQGDAKGLAVGDAEMDSFQISADGTRVVCLSGGRVVSWSLPRSII